VAQRIDMRGSRRGVIPRKSIPEGRLLESMGSQMRVMWWIAGLWLSGPATVLMGIAIERPSDLTLTRPAARRHVLA
jgi:hypothetical protein